MNNKEHAERKQLWVFAGPNGAGKSTFVIKYLKNKIPVINPDNIALQLDPKRRNEPLIVVKAGRLAFAERIKRLNNNESFAIETTMSGSSELRLMKQAKEKGYKVNLIYIGIKNADFSLERVAERVQKRGHSVPEEDINRRFQRSLDSLKEGMKIADRTYALDNTDIVKIIFKKEIGKKIYFDKNIPNWFKSVISNILQENKEG